jgi:hypothetical protein
LEQIKYGEGLQPSGAESFVLLLAVPEYANYNIAFCFIWL